MIKLLEDNTVICSDGAVINSSHSGKTTDPISTLIANAFTYVDDLLFTRPDFTANVIVNVQWENPELQYTVVDIAAENAGPNNLRAATRSNERTFTINPFDDDYSAAPQKVKDFISIIRTREAQAGYDAMFEQVMIDLTVMVDGVDDEGNAIKVPDTEEVEVMTKDRVEVINGVPTRIKGALTLTRVNKVVSVGMVEEDGSPVLKRKKARND